MKHRKAPKPKAVKGPFTADQFTPTKWDTTQDKANFANQLVLFITGGFQRAHFPLWFYRRLSNTFGHIAHYDEHGFWNEWFATLDDRVRFLEFTGRTGHAEGWSCAYGDAAWTYCDVERAVMQWMKENPFQLAKAKAALALENHRLETAEYERLKAKLEPTAQPGESGVGITCGACRHSADFEYFSTLNPREFECPSCHHAWRIETGKVVAEVGGQKVRERKIVHLPKRKAA